MPGRIDEETITMPVTLGADCDMSDLEEKFTVVKETGHGCLLVIDNLPVVDDKKLGKLQDVVKKLIGKQAKGAADTCTITMPKGSDTGKTLGFAFVALSSEDAAQAVLKGLDNHRLDKSHVLAVNLLDDVEKFADFDETFVEPEVPEYEEKEHIKSWLMDSSGRDQFVQVAGDNVSICWNNKMDDPEVIESRPKWSEFFVQWSPNGSYLATFHRPGAQLWGGLNWTRFARFPHPNVKLIDFSPNENFVVTWSVDPCEFEPGEFHNIAVWETRTGTRLRSFSFDISTLEKKEEEQVEDVLMRPEPKSPVQIVKAAWPIFKWSYDDKYLARISPQGISVYETPSMGLLDKTSIKVSDVQAIDWSPKDHILSFWTPESGNIPARLSLMEIPSRNIIRKKNIFNVKDCQLHWQNDGKYLLARVDVIKAKKQLGTNFEIFRLKEKDVPIDVLEVKAGEIVTSVSWEPNGDRFIVTADDGPRAVANFYQMVVAGNTTSDTVEAVKLLRKLDAKGVNRVAWSPKGRYAVLASLGQGDLSFWDLEEDFMMGSGEHYLMCDVSWDPTGRYVVSHVSFWHTKNDNGFAVWSINGTSLYRIQIQQFKQFLWRNRPPTLLSPQQEKKIRKDLKKYSKEFDELDSAVSNRASKDVIERRLKQWDEWVDFRLRCLDAFEPDRAAADKILDKYGYDEYEETEEVVEEILEETEELI